MSNNYDAIVIGAGPGGSTIAGLLASKGKKILVVDKNTRAGGRMVTIHRDGHVYEMFPHNLMPFAPSLFEKLAEETGKSNKIRNVAAEFKGNDMPKILFRNREGKTILLDMTDPKSLEDAGISALDMAKVANFTATVLSMNEKEIAELENISAYDFMIQQNLPDAFFVQCTAAYGEGAYEMSSDKVPASHLVRIMQIAMSDEHRVPRYYEGGIGGFFQTILETVEENGGTLLMGNRVKSIDVKDGKAIGITTDNEESYTAPVIISSAGIRQTVYKLVGEEHFDKDYAERVKGLESNLADIGYRYFTNKPILETSTFVYFPWNCLESWNEFEEMAQGKRKPENNYVYIGTKSIYPTIAPEGKQVIYACMSCHPDPDQDFQPYLDYVEDKMKDFFPQMFEEGVIERREIMSLDDVYKLGTERVFPRQGGESFGIANSIGQSDGDMPKCKTPLDGLYLVGNDAEGFGIGTHRAVDSGFKLFGHLKEVYHTF